MNTTRILRSLALAGLLFSGYLSGVKLFGGACAFNESCPLFLGYPTCYYGFIMFAGIALALFLEWRGVLATRCARKIILGVATVGILFAGYYTIREVPRIATEGIGAYMLGLPTCAYGLVVYIALALTTLRGLFAGDGNNQVIN